MRPDHAALPVRSYVALATVIFKAQAASKFIQMVRMGLSEDWHQEIVLAALQAEKSLMVYLVAKRFFNREADRAMRRMGYRRPTINGRRVRQLANQLTPKDLHRAYRVF